MPAPNFRQLFQQYLQGRLQPSQLKALRTHVQAAEETEELDQLLLEAYTNPALQAGGEAAAEWVRLQNSIAAGSATVMPMPKPAARRLWVIGIAAALCALSVALWLVIPTRTATNNGRSAASAGAIVPGKPGAILTLSDGRRLVLDSMGNGQIATDNGSTLVLNNNQLIYNAATAGTASAIHTLTTPAGKQFRLALPDGTQVWLNAASSIEFPSAFNGRERTIRVTGEAYLEVVPAKNQPFYIVTQQAKVAVLGTGLNVSAYNDDAVSSITLATGSIQVSDLHASAATLVQLVPGQQALLKTDAAMVVQQVNLNEVTAWKNNRFFYRSVPAKDFLKAIARWYNITVEYEGKVPDQELWINYSRDQPLETTLEVLRNSNIRFELVQRRLIVKE
ncbi:FecR family protein [Filimonas lacunae]|uniref:FecR family protein n=1 Tax=Filimonas lacunae TaxID=477680 RepID=A0A173MBU7_9BACT|nr:FecR family protein [Filimonas lacunae]BAV05044.1 anti-sigma factor [Filimonas lacunae]SIT33597.1 FecR family protein [Filimonas lacunae]